MSFDTQILQFMAQSTYRPMKRHELAHALHLESQELRTAFRHALYALEESGKVVRLRKNRWSLPDMIQHVVGTLKFIAQGSAFFIPDQPGEPDVYIAGKNTGTAFPGDTVSIEVYHSDYAARQRERRGHGEQLAEGRVINVLKRANAQTVGLLHHTPYYSYVVPDAVGFKHDIRVKDAQHVPKNHKVLVRLDDWIDPYKPLTGSILEDLGAMHAPGVDVDSLLRTAGIEEEFPADVVAEAEQLSGKITAEQRKGRRDLREAVIFTIDPETAKDYDDAISIEPHAAGGWLLGVHIADVSAFVQPGTLIDKEAYHRGNSIYLVDRAVMMLPRELTTKVCSLNPNHDHLAHSVELHLSPSGELLGYESFPSIIHSKARLTYAQAQQFIDGAADHGIPEIVVQRLENLCPLVKKSRQARVENGAVEINTPEIDIQLNAQGRVQKMMPRAGSKEAYQLIEECMLLANRAVAEILLASERPSIYRIHDEPDVEQWAAMGMELQALGIPKLPQTRAEINEAVRMATGTAVEYTANLAILRNFKRAEYSSTQIGHFGLAFDDYTHFTSPIRRYPDLLVHRMLKAIEQGQPPSISIQQIEEMAKHCNETERKAAELERQSIDAKRMNYYAGLLNQSPTTAFKGFIVSIKGKGMIVELPDSLQRGMVTFKSIATDWLEANHEMTKVQTRGGKTKYTIGDEVAVVLSKVDTARGFVDFTLADPTPAPRRRSKKNRMQPDLKTGRSRHYNKRRQ